uniref:protein adenylyltransferase n=1 Tax=Schistocephalus solidus TaxID=70667 RepID=A0A0V0J7R3_SCHSO
MARKSWRGSIFTCLAVVVFVVSLCPFSLWSHVLRILAEHTQLASMQAVIRSSTIYVVFQKIIGTPTKSPFTLPKCLLPAGETYNPEYAFISDLIRLRNYRPGKSNYFQKSFSRVATSSSREAQSSFLLAIKQQALGRSKVALKLLKHAAQLDPNNAVILTALGEALEKDWDDVKENNLNSRQSRVSALSVKKSSALKSSVPEENLVAAESLYARALIENPQYQKATKNQRRTRPVVEQFDQQRLKNIDQKVARFYLVPESNPGLRLVKIEHYFQHIYHSNAIEGNTLSLAQTRAVLETRIAVGGKSLQEQNEVLGLDAAFRFLNTTLLKGSSAPIEVNDLLELHRRVLSFVDLTEAGRFRKTQVFVADHTPPAAELIPQLMDELMTWVNSEEAAELHPIEQAALAHWKLVYIHPFYDGNGRTARLLMNLILMRVGFPPAIIRKEDRHLYYETLKTANIGDVRPFIRFITDCAERTLDDYLVAAYGSSVVDVRAQGPAEISLPAPTSLTPITSAIQFAPPPNFLLAPEKPTWSEMPSPLPFNTLRETSLGKGGDLPEVIYSN